MPPKRPRSRRGPGSASSGRSKIDGPPTQTEEPNRFCSTSERLNDLQAYSARRYRQRSEGKAKSRFVNSDIEAEASFDSVKEKRNQVIHQPVNINTTSTEATSFSSPIRPNARLNYDQRSPKSATHCVTNKMGPVRDPNSVQGKIRRILLCTIDSNLLTLLSIRNDQGCHSTSI